MLERILITLVFFIAVCAGYTAYTMHTVYSQQVIAIDCNHGEDPRECQARLGSQFEVLYNATTGEAWAELK